MGRTGESADALRHKLEWFRASANNAIFKAIETWFTEKKVPLRKVMGSNIRAVEGGHVLMNIGQKCNQNSQESKG
jgi:hypothetical protein